MYFVVKFSVALKIILWMTLIGVVLWLAMEWRVRQRVKEQLELHKQQISAVNNQP